VAVSAPDPQQDSYQRDIAEGLSEAFDDDATEEVELDLDSAKVIVFSDHHKGARDGADDFWRCERAYHAALGYYLEAGHELIVLGDVEELWECRPEDVLAASRTRSLSRPSSTNSVATGASGATTTNSGTVLPRSTSTCNRSSPVSRRSRC
jgi:hypothetical protein